MAAENHAEVLVVGAGPVGLLTACVLSRQAVRVRIIDKKPGIEPQSDACLLHSRSWPLLNTLGLNTEPSDLGRRADIVSFYQGQNRRAQVKLSELNVEFPFVQILPKSRFKTLLESSLREAGIQVDWNHRLTQLELEGEHVCATIEKLAVSAKGYIIPEMDWEVEKTEHLKADYVLAADGDDSKVAQLIGTGYERVGAPEFYLICELESDWPVQNDVSVILDPQTTSMLWPLPGNTFRWSFQLNEEQLRQFPFKERSSIRIEQPALDQANKESIAAFVHQRAPWFTGSIGEIHWSTDAEFTHRLATRLGDGRCWLMGDAAHVTSPAGMQSMNAGLTEAVQFAESLSGVLHRTASTETLAEYSRNCREEWQRLLGLTAWPEPQAETKPWVRERAARILSCIPASGPELRLAANQLALDYPFAELLATR